MCTQPDFFFLFFSGLWGGYIEHLSPSHWSDHMTQKYTLHELDEVDEGKSACQPVFLHGYCSSMDIMLYLLCLYVFR